MPWGNPIVAGEELVRESIHSPDYVPGVSGWSINRDGSAEFNDATFRGYVLIRSDKAILILNSVGNLLYSIAGEAGTFGSLSYAEGFVAYGVSDTFPGDPATNSISIQPEPGDGGIYFKDLANANATNGQPCSITRVNNVTVSRLGLSSGRMASGNSTSDAEIRLTSDNQALTVFRSIDLEAFTINIGGSASSTATVNLTNAQTNITGTVNASSTVMRSQSADEGTNITGFSNTAFAAGTPVCGVSFTAPPSGSGKFLFHVNCEPDTADDLFFSVEVRTGATIGSGTVVRAGSSDRAIHPPQIAGTGELQAGTYWEISGLTPGSVYNAFTVHRMTAGTGSIFHRALRWEPDF